MEIREGNDCKRNDIHGFWPETPQNYEKITASPKAYHQSHPCAHRKRPAGVLREPPEFGKRPFKDLQLSQSITTFASGKSVDHA
ncbi:MAG: hypothetical protein K2H17_05730 [Duncaniella sp.]|uniref:hypothetical protein n=1 Tax=Duncaniella sp. TaxID=2518496 RepID=UPI0023D26EDD|nr:hypothetical protein [Duncaniella sp.]MDE5988877.1 hypothetical protein [Duncaniella sp.]